jgi:hypothetical protein
MKGWAFPTVVITLRVMLPALPVVVITLRVMPPALPVVVITLRVMPPALPVVVITRSVTATSHSCGENHHAERDDYFIIMGSKHRPFHLLPGKNSLVAITLRVMGSW